MTYLTLKSLHILSMVLLFGTGLGSAFYKFSADCSGNVQHIANTNRHVVFADWIFTTPTVIFQPISGIWMTQLAGIPLTTPWVLISLILYVIAGCCWLPVVWLQIRMRILSGDALKNQTSLTAEYWRYTKIWFCLGIPAFIAMVLIVLLMVFKRI
jgi:uncharacterized membrane protein